VYVLGDSQYANVKGYQAAGETHAKVKPIPCADEELPELTVLRYEAPKAPAAPATSSATTPKTSAAAAVSDDI
jgi:hypothetical protein